MGSPAQVGAFAVGARAGAVVKQMDISDVWGMLLRAFGCVWAWVAS